MIQVYFVSFILLLNTVQYTQTMISDELLFITGLDKAMIIAAVLSHKRPIAP